MTDASERARFEGDESDDEFDDEEPLGDEENELSPIEGMVHDSMNVVAPVDEPEDG